MTAKQPMPTLSPNHALRRYRALQRKDLLGAHAATSNQDTASVTCPTENKESR